MDIDFGGTLFYHAASPTSRLEISEIIEDVSFPFSEAMSPFNSRMWTGCDSTIANDTAITSSSMSPEYCNLQTPAISQFLPERHVTSPTSSTKHHASPLLPPCRVCGEKASGFHYGANTCEACKGFFRRSLQRKDDYRCAGNGRCDILPGRRSVCAYCRYRKCLSVGMSKQAIKTGRYTHEKKTRDIQEVKRLQQLQQLQEQNNQRTVCRCHHQTNKESPSPFDDDVMVKYDTEMTSSVTEDVKYVLRAIDPSVNDEKPITSFPDGSQDVGSAMDSLIGKITKLHEQQTPHTREFFDRLPARETEYVEQRTLRQEVFGPMQPLTVHEYLRIYRATGIDVDGRRDMIKHMIPCIEKTIKRFITFAKALPGFVDLPLDDQITLIKGSRFEAWLLSAHKAFNARLNIFTHACGYTVHLDEMTKLYDIGFLQSVFRLAQTIQRFDLSVEEVCIFKGIIVLSRDRCSLQQPEAVERHQMTMIQLLERLRCKRRPEDRLFVARIIGVLSEMRTVTELHERQENKIGTEWCTDIKIPPLLYELFSV